MKSITSFIILISIVIFAGCSGTGTDEYLNGDFISTLGDNTAPGIVRPAPGDIVDYDYVYLEWASRMGASEYTVEIATDPGFVNQIPNSPYTVRAPMAYLILTDESDIKLPDGRTYYWRVRADTTDPGLYAKSYFEAMEDKLFVYCPAGEECDNSLCNDSEGANTYCVGNRSKPLRSIRGAINDAADLRMSAVAIAARGSGAGNAAYVEMIEMEDGVSLYGGYDGAFDEAARDPNTYETILQSVWNIGITAEYLTSNTQVDGIIIRETEADDYTYGIISQYCSGTLKINNCKVQVSGSSSEGCALFSKRSKVELNGCTLSISNGSIIYNIKNEYGNLIINDSVITVGMGFGDGFGIKSNNSSLTISDSVITAGMSTGTGYGIYSDNCTLTISGTSITMGTDDGLNGAITGIYNKSVFASIVDNIISLKKSSVSRVGIRQLDDVSVGSEISGNTISAVDITGTGEDAGICLCNSPGVTINGNTITMGAGYYGAGLKVESASHNVKITNNVITKGSGSSSANNTYAIELINSNIIKLSNNTFTTTNFTYTNTSVMADTCVGLKLINNNVTTGGASGATYASVGVSLVKVGAVDDYAIITGNSIKAGNAANSHGVYVGNKSYVNLMNNIISAGTATTNSNGVYYYIFTGISGAYNNTIDSGIASGENTGMRFYCTLGSGGDIYVTNNIVTTADGSGTRYGLFEVYGDIDITSNNNFIFTNGGTDYSGTILGKTGDVTGANPSLDSSYRLQASSPDSAKYGGTDLSASFTTDILGVTRTAVIPDGHTPGNGGAGWSMGAYEYVE